MNVLGNVNKRLVRRLFGGTFEVVDDGSQVFLLEIALGFRQGSLV